MFLEAQFGPMISPIVKPKLPTRQSKSSKIEATSNTIKSEDDGTISGDDMADDGTISGDDMADDDADLEAEELERLHSIGIPVPGVEIKVDKNVAKVWLETLEVECANGVLRDRVKAVVERAVETVAPLWGQNKR